MQRLTTFLVFLVTACITTVSAYAGSQYMLMASPLRVIFDDRHRAEQMTIVNISEEEVHYAISIVNLHDKEGKRVVATDETEQEQIVRKMIRFSPRRATIGPKEHQVVKLMVRKPKDLPPGEYITHLQITPVPKDKKDKKEASGEALKIDLDVIVSTRFPIIIQHELPPAEVTPTAFTVQKTEEYGNVALVTLSREGQLSSFGNVYLFYVPKNSNQQTKRVGLAQGIAIYQPKKQQQSIISLKDITEQELQSGSIRVQYTPSRGVAEKRPGKKQTTTRDFPLGS